MVNISLLPLPLQPRAVGNRATAKPSRRQHPVGQLCGSGGLRVSIPILPWAGDSMHYGLILRNPGGTEELMFVTQ